MLPPGHLAMGYLSYAVKYRLKNLFHFMLFSLTLLMVLLYTLSHVFSIRFLNTSQLLREANTAIPSI